ncbi:MAG: hypothetical protein IJV82_05075 [Oscillospiraceae bacterium]|nr:hypothetical protein [Oscillospiraceae bacterium]
MILVCAAVVLVLIILLVMLRPNIEKPSKNESRTTESSAPTLDPWTPATDPSESTIPARPQIPSTAPTTAPYNPYLNLDQPPSDILLRCDYPSAYTGKFVEDGTDRNVKNVASLLITNMSDQFLEYGKLIYMVGDTEVVFEISSIPAGRSAWVMEKNAMPITDDAVFDYVDGLTLFADEAISNPEELTIQYGSNMLRVQNDSDRTLENVTVYYKAVHKDGRYLGGIAYRIKFGTLAPGEAAEKVSGHYQEDQASIVRVTWQESSEAETS